MILEITKAGLGERIPVQKPIPEFLIEVQEQGIRNLISEHYELLKNSEIAGMFPQDDEGIEEAKKNASDFFIQICGGPAYFIQNRGAPQIIGRHAPFAIDANAREVWLELFKPILFELEKQDVTETSLKSFWNYLDIFSIWMINTK
ncbi:MAG: globin [Campylobacterota bacterium]|nr:globin [Campylobacterota bacterium]